MRVKNKAPNAPNAAGGFPQTPLTEEFETQEVREQEVREQLYICEVLHVGLKPQHAAPHKWCQDKSKDFTCQGRKEKLLWCQAYVIRTRPKQA